MSVFFSFIKREPVLMIAASAAVISCFFVPPDLDYIKYFDFRTLSLLYALMTVVSGLKEAGLFSHLAHVLCGKAGSIRTLTLILVGLSFFSAMLITNDVALITFVPFAVFVLTLTNRRQELIYVVVLQTIAANLGSMLTPVGNPQNLFLYSYYDFSVTEFLCVTFPGWGLSLLLLMAACFLVPGTKLTAFQSRTGGLNHRALALYLSLFAFCLLVVLRLLPWPLMLAGLILILLLLDRASLLKADFMLLLTFAAFFIFAGNLARLTAVSQLLRTLLSGREYMFALLSSQCISNVPAALLLSGFTENARSLLLGVDIGGLGTPIASLASLISLKLYSHVDYANLGKYLLEFTLLNVAFLLLLSGFTSLL